MTMPSVVAQSCSVTTRSCGKYPSRKPLRKTFRREVLQGQYEVRVRRVSADETFDVYISNLNWTQLRTYQPDQADYTGQKFRVLVEIETKKK